jgi:4-hydroxybenzoate polyprenyltransferase
VTAFARLSRPRDWAFSKLPFVAAAALLLDVSPERTLLVLATLVPWAAFGYGLNEACDRRQDERAGRASRARRLSSSAILLFLAVTATAAVALSLLWSNGIVVAAGLLLAAAYSASPVRLKERGGLGVVAGAAAQWVLPVLALAHGAAAIPLLLLSFAVGVRWMLVHQAADAGVDRRAGVRTYGAATAHIGTVLRCTFAAELALLGLVFATLGARAVPALVALLPTLAWRRAVPLADRLETFVDSPLSLYYFCLLPALLAFAVRSPASYALGAAVLILGTPAVLGALPRTQLAHARP